MFPSKLQPLRTAGLAVLAVSCGALLGVSPPDPSDGETGGNGHGGAKTGGRAGMGGSGNGATEQGGTSSGAEAGEGTGGSPLGGASTTGGRATGGESAGNGGGAGDDGAGGEPEPVFPKADSACSVPGALACVRAHSTKRLLCKGGMWTETDDCPTGPYPQLCDRKTGTCGLLACPGPDPGPWLCSGDDLLICGPDLVTESLETCLFGCVQATLAKPACDGPANGELLIDQPGPLRTPSGVWPNPLIPVCLRDPDADAWASARAVRERIDTTWGRFSSVGFPGWDECDDAATGVELRFVDDCEQELARVPFLGYPGPSVTLPIELCRKYLDSEGMPQEVGDELLSFVALHVFGHVLGLEDLRLDRDVMRLMEQVLQRVTDLATFEGFTLSAEDIQVLQYVYGSKPSHSLVGPNGRCLSFASGTLSSEACDGSAAQRFQPEPAELAHGVSASGSCLRKASDSGESVELAPCTGDASREAFLTSRVRWQVSRGRCAGLRENGSQEGSPLVVAACEPNWPSSQAFGFDFLGADKVRIRTATGQCVTSPNIWNAGSYPGLGTCGGGQDIFDVRDGRLGVAGQCLTPVSRNTLGLEFSPCSAFDDHHFALSGPLALGSSALTFTNADPPELTLTPLDDEPLANQILFDYHF